MMDVTKIHSFNSFVSRWGQDTLRQSQSILTFLSDTFFRLVFKIIVKIIWKLLIFFLSLQREG